MSLGSSNATSSDGSGVSRFLSASVPQIKKQIITGGKSVESSESVAQRILQHLDNDDNAGSLLTEIIASYHEQESPEEKAKEKQLDELVYKALSHALGKEYKSAVYPESSPDKESVGSNLYVSTVAQTKADKVSEKLARRLLDRKPLMAAVESRLPGTIKLKQSDPEAMREIRAKILDNRSQVKRELQSATCEVPVTTRIGDRVVDGVVSVNKWDALIKSLDPLQVSFIDMPTYGTAEIRNSPSFEEASRRKMMRSAAGGAELAPYQPVPGQMPSRWQEDRDKMLKWADIVSLRTLATQALDPFFKYAQDVPAATFDKFKKIQKLIGEYNRVKREYANLEQREFPADKPLQRSFKLQEKNGELAQARREVIDQLRDPEELRQQMQLAVGLLNCAAQCPSIEIDVEATNRLFVSMGGQKDPDKRAKIAEKLAPAWVKKTLAAVPQSLQAQSNRLMEFLDSSEVKAAIGRENA